MVFPEKIAAEKLMTLSPKNRVLQTAMRAPQLPSRDQRYGFVPQPFTIHDWQFTSQSSIPQHLSFFSSLAFLRQHSALDAFGPTRLRSGQDFALRASCWALSVVPRSACPFFSFQLITIHSRRGIPDVRRSMFGVECLLLLPASDSVLPASCYPAVSSGVTFKRFNLLVSLIGRTFRVGRPSTLLYVASAL